MSHIPGPDEVYGKLFDAVQSGHVFADSKTFVDAIPKSSPAAIVERYAALEISGADKLREFVLANFNMPQEVLPAAEPDTRLPVRARIDELWDVLLRAGANADSGSSLIALPRPYVVPGGRFREIYYWDSYFTMLGLAEAGRYGVIENMVDNFAYLVDKVGFIPNGNRSYFCSRSQPPFFVLMVELLAKVLDSDSVYQKYLPQLRREYDYWMDGIDRLQAQGEATRHAVKVGDGFLNRYWDESDTPRPESYAEDQEHARYSKRNAPELYREIRAACESGWDFSSRWFEDAGDLGSIRTTSILPVDLNSLLYKLETSLSTIYASAGENQQAGNFESRAAYRKEVLQTLFFDATSGRFVDIELDGLTPTAVPSLATAFPLYLGISTAPQAEKVSSSLRDDFLAPGGWRTTLIESGQQWDRPNGWAPLQWVTFHGLEKYGYVDDARVGATRWVENSLETYSRTGRLLEKYDVENIGALASGGEYSVQDGFGWTNAVLLKFMNLLDKSSSRR
jgi:alpha,alpha-trehalase